MQLLRTRRYCQLRLLLAPGEAEGFFMPFVLRFWPILGLFWCPLVTVVTFGNLKKNTKSLKRNKKIFKKKYKKIQKNLLKKAPTI